MRAAGGVGSSLNGSPAGAPQNPYTFAGEYSYSNVDTPIRWATSISYELPIGKGKDAFGQQQPGSRYDRRRLGHQHGVGLSDRLPAANLSERHQLAIRLRRPAPEHDEHVAFGPAAAWKSAFTTTSIPPRSTAAPAATFGNTPRTLGSLRGPGREELGSLGLQELRHQRADEGTVPGGGAQRLQLAVFLFAEHKFVERHSSDRSTARRTSRGNCSLRSASLSRTN